MATRLALSKVAKSQLFSSTFLLKLTDIVPKVGPFGACVPAQVVIRAEIFLTSSTLTAPSLRLRLPRPGGCRSPLPVKTNRQGGRSRCGLARLAKAHAAVLLELDTGSLKSPLDRLSRRRDGVGLTAFEAHYCGDTNPSRLGELLDRPAKSSSRHPALNRVDHVSSISSQKSLRQGMHDHIVLMRAHLARRADRPGATNTRPAPTPTPE
jgi:hypothetical protein